MDLEEEQDTLRSAIGLLSGFICKGPNHSCHGDWLRLDKKYKKRLEEVNKLIKQRGTRNENGI